MFGRHGVSVDPASTSTHLRGSVETRKHVQDAHLPAGVVGSCPLMKEGLKDQASWGLTFGLILLLPNYQNILWEACCHPQADAHWRAVRDNMPFPLTQGSWQAEASSEASGGGGPEREAGACRPGREEYGCPGGFLGRIWGPQQGVRPTISSASSLAELDVLLRKREAALFRGWLQCDRILSSVFLCRLSSQKCCDFWCFYLCDSRLYLTCGYGRGQPQSPCTAASQPRSQAAAGLFLP